MGHPKGLCGDSRLRLSRRFTAALSSIPTLALSQNGTGPPKFLLTPRQGIFTSRPVEATVDQRWGIERPDFRTELDQLIGSQTNGLVSQMSHRARPD